MDPHASTIMVFYWFPGLAQDPTFKHIGDILESWGTWADSEEAEADLQLEVSEIVFYTDPELGEDKRFLEFTDQAPTVLHSYSNATIGLVLAYRDSACGPQVSGAFSSS